MQPGINIKEVVTQVLGVCCTHFSEEALFNVFLPPLIQDLVIAGKVLFNVLWFWGPKNTGPNPDHL